MMDIGSKQAGMVSALYNARGVSMKHTKGPWIRSGGRSANIVDLNGDTAIADIKTIKTYSGPKTKKEFEANANLIAAAPDLLIELEKLTSEIEGNILYSSEREEQGSTDQWLQALIDDAKKAIKKAKGNI